MGSPTNGLPRFLPSPSRGSIDLGFLELRAYGMMIALGVVAAVWVAQKRWVAKGGHQMTLRLSHRGLYQPG